MAGVWAHWHDRRVTASCHSHVRHGWGHWARISASRTWLATGRWGWGWRRDEETGWRRRWGRARVEAGRSWRTAVLLLLFRWLWLVHLLLFRWCRHELLLAFRWSHKLLLAIRSGHELLLGVRCRHVSCHGRCLVRLRFRSWLLLVRAGIIAVGAWGTATSFAGLWGR